MKNQTIATRIEAYKGREIKTDTTYIFYFFNDEESHELTTGWVSERVDFDGLVPIGSFPCGDMLFARSGGKLWVLTHDEFEGWESKVRFDEFMERVLALDVTIEDEVFS